MTLTEETSFMRDAARDGVWLAGSRASIMDMGGPGGYRNCIRKLLFKLPNLRPYSLDVLGGCLTPKGRWPR